MADSASLFFFRAAPSYHPLHLPLPTRNSAVDEEPNTSMEQSPLQTLPPELRNRIYKLVFTHEEPIELSAWDDDVEDPLMFSDEAFVENYLALTRTCRVAREESTQHLYASNTFMFDVDAAREPLFALDCFQTAIGKANAAALKAVIIKVMLSSLNGDRAAQLLLIRKTLMELYERAQGGAKCVYKLNIEGTLVMEPVVVDMSNLVESCHATQEALIELAIRPDNREGRRISKIVKAEIEYFRTRVENSERRYCLKGTRARFTTATSTH